MENTHSKYYNDTPEEAFKKFRKDYKIRAAFFIVIIFVLLIGTCVLAIRLQKQIIFNPNAPYLYEVSRAAFGLLYMLMLVVIGFLGLKIGMPLVMRPSVQLINIFMGDCDPVKMYDIYILWEQLAKTERQKNTFLLEKAQCCRYIPERWEEGMTYLEQVDFKKTQMDWEASRLFNIAAYAKYRNDRAGFEQAKADLEQLPNQFPGIKAQSKQRVHYEKLLQAITVQELLWDEKDAEARTLLNTLLRTEIFPLNKVMFHMYLARLDMKEKAYENAREHLEYVITYGNKLPVVPEAKELLDTCG